MENMGYIPVQNMGYPQPPKKKSRAGIIIACVAAGVIFIGAIAGVIIWLLANYGTSLNGRLDIIRIEGEITSTDSSSLFSSGSGYNHKFILNTIDQLIDDDSSKGILVFLNTPGGGVYESDEVYQKLLEYKETGRPVYAYMGQMAASGGYYIASAADKIYCNRNTLTGSIGVIMGTYIDLSEFLSRYGVTSNTFTSGPNKSMGSQYAPMTDEQKRIFQSIVDEAYEQFVGVVANGRGMQVGDVKRIADGRVYTAKQALDNNLVDEICTYEEALTRIKEELGDKGLFENEHNPPLQSGFASLFSSLSKIAPKNEAEVILDTLKAYNKTGYYCPELAE